MIKTAWLFVRIENKVSDNSDDNFEFKGFLSKVLIFPIQSIHKLLVSEWEKWQFMHWGILIIEMISGDFSVVRTSCMVFEPYWYALVDKIRHGKVIHQKISSKFSMRSKLSFFLKPTHPYELKEVLIGIFSIPNIFVSIGRANTFLSILDWILFLCIFRIKKISYFICGDIF